MVIREIKAEFFTTTVNLYKYNFFFWEKKYKY